MKNFFLLLFIFTSVFTTNAQTNSSSKTKTLEFEKRIIINVPIDKLWDITANDFAGIDKWNTDINVSEGTGESINELDYNTRVCKAHPDDSNAYIEKITNFDSKNYTFSYQPINLPPNWKEATSKWIHKKRGKSTELTISQTAVFNTLQSAENVAQLKAFLEASFDRVLGQLKIFAETGQPSEEKINKIKTYKDNLKRGVYNFKVFPPFNNLEQVYDQHVPSPLVATHIKGNNNHVKIIYSRPSLNGRKMIGKDIPFGKVWRLGANEQTEITSQESFSLGGKKFDKGSYSLFAIPNQDKWQIIINSALGDWGAFSYNKDRDLHTYDATVKKAIKTFEKFTIWFSDDGTGINMAWGDTQVTIPLEL